MQQVYDLGQPYFVGMPHMPSHPPFLFGLTKLHGDVVYPEGGSSASDSIAMSGHTGTHIDALGHFSRGGMFHGGIPVATNQSHGTGVARHSADEIAPIVRRGVLLDVAGAAPLADSAEIGPEELERACRTEIRTGDVVLIRTGWAQHFHSSVRFYNGGRMPGVNLDGARWLSQRGIFAAGADTLSFEKTPNPNMPVHVHLLVERGIHIIENLNLEELARDGVYEFRFLAAPLKIRGGTGAPVRPIALRE